MSAPLVDVQPPVVEIAAATEGIFAGEIERECDTGVGSVCRGVSNELGESVRGDVRLDVPKGGLDVGSGLDIGRGSDDFVSDVETEDCTDENKGVQQLSPK